MSLPIHTVSLPVSRDLGTGHSAAATAASAENTRGFILLILFFSFSSRRILTRPLTTFRPENALHLIVANPSASISANSSTSTHVVVALRDSLDLQEHSSPVHKHHVTCHCTRTLKAYALSIGISLRMSEPGHSTQFFAQVPCRLLKLGSGDNARRLNAPHLEHLTFPIQLQRSKPLGEAKNVTVYKCSQVFLATFSN